MICQINKAGLKSPVLFNRLLAGQLPIDEIIRAEHSVDAFEIVRFMLFKPAQLRSNELLVDAITSGLRELCLVDFACNLGDFVGWPAE